MVSQKMRSLLFLACVGLSLSGCGGGGGDKSLPGLPKDTTVPIVSSNYPASEETDVEPDDRVIIEFSELMDQGSLLNGGIQLYSGEESGETDVAIEPRPQHITFTNIPGIGIDLVTGENIDIEATQAILRPPKQRFALDTSYTVKISTVAKDLADDPETPDTDEANSVASENLFTFTIQDGIWQDFEDLSFTLDKEDEGDVNEVKRVLAGDTFSPQLASNANGDVLAVWLTTENGVSSIWASRYLTASQTWRHPNPEHAGSATAEQVNNLSVTSAFAPKLALNKNGQAAVAWYQSPAAGQAPAIWVNIFDGALWLGPTIVSTGQLAEALVDSPEIAIDDDGNIFVAWREQVDVSFGADDVARYYRIKTNRYNALPEDAPTGWDGSAYSFNTTARGDSHSLRLITSAQGIGQIVWAQDDAGVSSIYASRFETRRNSWSEMARVDTRADGNNSGSAVYPDLAIDRNNDVFAIWQQHDGARYNIWLNRFAGNSWGSPVLMETDNRGDASLPKVAFGYDNQAFAIWSQNVPSSSVVTARKFDPQAGTWAQPVILHSSALSDRPAELELKFDREGNALAIWVSESRRISANRYSERSQWLGVENVGGEVNESQAVVLAPLEEDGRMLSLWYRFDGADFTLSSALFSD